MDCQSTKHPTGSAVPHWIKEFYNGVKISSVDMKVERELKHVLKSQLDKFFERYISSANNFLIGACFDTRYSYKLTRDYNIPTNIIDDCWKRATEEGSLLFSDVASGKEMVKSMLSQNLQLIRKHLENPEMSPEMKADPYRFWRIQHGCAFLQSAIQLCRPIAAMYLSIPAGAPDCERGFSYVGLLVNDLTSRFAELTVEARLIINSYLKSPEYEFEKLVNEFDKLINDAMVGTKS